MKSIEIKKIYDTILDLVDRLVNEIPTEYTSGKTEGVTLIKAIVYNEKSIAIYDTDDIGVHQDKEFEDKHKIMEVLRAEGNVFLPVSTMNMDLKDIMRVRILGTEKDKNGRDNRYYSYCGIDTLEQIPRIKTDDGKEITRYGTDTTTLIFKQRRLYFDPESENAKKNGIQPLYSMAEINLSNYQDELIYYIHKYNSTEGFVRTLANDNREYYIKDNKTGKFTFINSSAGIAMSKIVIEGEAGKNGLIDKEFDLRFNTSQTSRLSFSANGYIVKTEDCSKLIGNYDVKKKAETNISQHIIIPDIRKSNITDDIINVLKQTGIVFAEKGSLFKIFNSETISNIEYKNILVLQKERLCVKTHNLEVVIPDTLVNINEEITQNAILSAGYDIIYDTNGILTYDNVIKLAKKKLVIIELEDISNIEEIDKRYMFNTDSNRLMFISLMKYIISSSTIKDKILVHGYEFNDNFKSFLKDKKYYLFNGHLEYTHNVDKIIKKIVSMKDTSLKMIEGTNDISRVVLKVTKDKKQQETTKILEGANKISGFSIIKYLSDTFNEEIPLHKGSYITKLIKIIVDEKEDLSIILKILIKVTDKGLTFTISPKTKIDKQLEEDTLRDNQTTVSLLLQPGKIVNFYGLRGTGKTDMLEYLYQNIFNKRIIVVDKENDIYDNSSESPNNNIVYFINSQHLDIYEIGNYRPDYIFVNSDLEDSERNELLNNKLVNTTIILASKSSLKSKLTYILTEEQKQDMIEINMNLSRNKRA